MPPGLGLDQSHQLIDPDHIVKFRFLRLVPDEGEPHYGASRVLECKRLRAPAEIARLLDIRTGDSVVQIRRVLTFSNEATVLDEIWLLGTNFKGLTAERLSSVFAHPVAVVPHPRHDCPLILPE